MTTLHYCYGCQGFYEAAVKGFCNECKDRHTQYPQVVRSK